MHWLKKRIYNFIKKGIKVYLNIFLEFRVWGVENIPDGPKIFCSNHFSSTDPFFMITVMDEPVHMVIGPGFSVPVFRHILKAGEQINALPERRKFVISEAVEYLKKGESIYIFPEGDLNDQVSFREFYHGMAKIYLTHPCPIIPIGVVSPIRYVKEIDKNRKIGETTFRTLAVMSGKYYTNIGDPLSFKPHVTAREITDTVKENIKYLIEDIKTNKFWS